MDVRLLWIGSHGPTHAEVSMVEEISHKTTTGKIFVIFYMLSFIINQSTVEKKTQYNPSTSHTNFAIDLLEHI